MIDPDSPLTLAIRPAKAADIPHLLALENASFSYDLIDAPTFRYYLTKAHAKTLLALQGQEPVGYASMFFNSRQKLARLYSIAISAAHRGQGIAARLYQPLEVEARRKGCRKVRLEARRDAAHLHKLYANWGFTRTALVKNYYDDGMDAVVMEKPLT